MVALFRLSFIRLITQSPASLDAIPTFRPCHSGTPFATRAGGNRPLPVPRKDVRRLKLVGRLLFRRPRNVFLCGWMRGSTSNSVLPTVGRPPASTFWDHEASRTRTSRAKESRQGRAGPRTDRPHPYGFPMVILTLMPRITTISSRMRR